MPRISDGTDERGLTAGQVRPVILFHPAASNTSGHETPLGISLAFVPLRALDIRLVRQSAIFESLFKSLLSLFDEANTWTILERRKKHETGCMTKSY